MLPPVLWAAVRFQLKGAAVALAIVTLMTASFTATGHGEFSARLELSHERAIMLQTFLGVTAVSALLVAALSLQRQQAVVKLEQANALLEQRVAERTATLLESETRFRHMADHAPVMIWVTEPDGSCSFLSRSWYEFTGQTQPEGLGFGWLNAVHPEDRSLAEEEFRQADSSHRPFRLDYRLRRADGVYRWAIDAASPRFDSSGRFLGYIGSVIDITDRKAAEQALLDTDRRKDEFLATLAHELRNPLAPIRNGLEILGLAGERDPELSEVREMMSRQLDHLVHLVNDLLDVSRISRGKINLRRETITVRRFINDAIETCQPAIQQKLHRLSLELPDADLLVDGDATRLAQVVANLIMNAVKYSEPAGDISCRALQDLGDVVISIQDRGVGIAPEVLPTLWNMFTQVRDTLDKSQGGLGIGLSLVKRLVELHGGSVAAESPGPGLGSTFIVRLPLLATAKPLTADSQLREAGAPNAAPLRVLIVDDNPDGLHTMAMMVRLLKHNTSTASTGQEALLKARSFRPDIVFLDIGLPDMSGHDVARLLRADPLTSPSRLVAMTGWGTEQDLRRSHQAGFDHHLTKPVELASVQAVFASHGAVSTTGA